MTEEMSKLMTWVISFAVVIGSMLGLTILIWLCEKSFTFWEYMYEKHRAILKFIALILALAFTTFIWHMILFP